jgi:heme exporter protein D
MISVTTVVTVVSIVIGVVGIILRTRRILNGVIGEEDRRENTLWNWYKENGGRDRLEIEVKRLEIQRSDKTLFLLKWFFLGRFTEFEGDTNVVMEFSGQNLGIGNTLADRFPDGGHNLFRGLPVSDGRVNKNTNGTVTAEFEITSANVEEVREHLGTILDRAAIQAGFR